MSRRQHTLGAMLASSVLPEVLPGTICFTALATIIACVSKLADTDIGLSTLMLTVLGSMLSFALSLRVSSSYERFNDGRRAFSTISLGSRYLATLIWTHAPASTVNAAKFKEMTDEEREVDRAKSLVEKRTMITLIEAFAVATKHYLRSEEGLYYDDLFHLTAYLPKYSFPTSIEQDNKSALLGLWRGADEDSFLPHEGPSRQGSLFNSVSTSAAMDSSVDLEKGVETIKIPLKPGFNPPKRTIYHFFPFLSILRALFRSVSKQGSRQRKRFAVIDANANIPLEILLFLHGYIAELVKRESLVAAYIGIFMGALNNMQESLTTLERVVSTPLPFAYQLHLRFSVYVYLLILPFSLNQALGYYSILGTAIAAIVFLGFYEVGRQLEQPFGYDHSDLDLDWIVQQLASELREIVSHPSPDPDDLIYHPANTLFAPTDPRSASDILKDLETNVHLGREGELRKLLAKHYNSLAIAKNEKAKRKHAVMQTVEAYKVC